MTDAQRGFVSRRSTVHVRSAAPLIYQVVDCSMPHAQRDHGLTVALLRPILRPITLF